MDLADELAQTQEGDAGVVTPKAASTRNELDHAFMIKGLVDDRSVPDSLKAQSTCPDNQAVSKVENCQKPLSVSLLEL